MERSLLKEKLEERSEAIFKKHYSSMPILQVNGGISYAIESAINQVSKIDKPTVEKCDLYFAANAAIIAYLEENGDEMITIYSELKKPRIGGAFGLEQLLGDEMTKEVIVTLLGLAAPYIEALPGRLYSFLKKRFRGKIPEETLLKHAEAISINIVNSPNVKIYIENGKIQKPKSKTSNKKKNSTHSKKKSKN